MATMEASEVNKLVDVMTQITVMVGTHTSFRDKTPDEIGAYIRDQLDKCGYPNTPMGSNHVYLTRSNFYG